MSAETNPPAESTPAATPSAGEAPPRYGWLGPALFLAGIVGLSFLFWPAQPGWMEAPRPEWELGMKAVREIQRTSMVYRDQMHEGQIDDMVTGPVRWNSGELNWRMTAFAEQLVELKAGFEPGEFFFLRAEDQFITILLRSTRPGAPQGWYSLNHLDDERFGETFAEWLPEGMSVADTADSPRYYIGSTVPEVRDRYPTHEVRPLGPVDLDGDPSANYLLFRTPTIGLAATADGQVIHLAMAIDAEADNDTARTAIRTELASRHARPLAPEAPVE